MHYGKTQVLDMDTDLIAEHSQQMRGCILTAKRPQAARNLPLLKEQKPNNERDALDPSKNHRTNEIQELVPYTECKQS